MAALTYDLRTVHVTPPIRELGARRRPRNPQLFTSGGGMCPGGLFGHSMSICWKPCRARVERVVDARSLSRDVTPCSFRVYGAQRSPPALPRRHFSGLRTPASPLKAGFCFQSSPLQIGYPGHATKADSRLAPQGGLLLSEPALANQISHPRHQSGLSPHPLQAGSCFQFRHLGLRVALQRHLLGIPRATALNKTCSSRVT